MLTKYLWVFFVSMVPLVELRGSIIISQGLQLPVLSSYIVAIIGNMLPVPVRSPIGMVIKDVRK